MQVSLGFDQNEDLDLHVIEPSGEEIYFANSNSDTGGELDLDSNPACSIDGINNENVYWPAGGAPPGTYEAFVHYWANCGASVVNWTITVHTGGSSSTYNGSFTASDEGPEGQHITFSY